MYSEPQGNSLMPVPMHVKQAHSRYTSITLRFNVMLLRHNTYFIRVYYEVARREQEYNQISPVLNQLHEDGNTLQLIA